VPEPQPYDREQLVATLVYHQRKSSEACACGWGEGGSKLGYSHAEHIADVYEQSVAARLEPS
jgi:hypothetical protein